MNRTIILGSALAACLPTTASTLAGGEAPSAYDRLMAQVAYDQACGVGTDPADPADPADAPVTRRTRPMQMVRL